MSCPRGRGDEMGHKLTLPARVAQARAGRAFLGRALDLCVHVQWRDREAAFKGGFRLPSPVTSSLWATQLEFSSGDAGNFLSVANRPGHAPVVAVEPVDR